MSISKIYGIDNDNAACRRGKLFEDVSFFPSTSSGGVFHQHTRLYGNLWTQWYCRQLMSHPVIHFQPLNCTVVSVSRPDMQPLSCNWEKTCLAFEQWYTAIRHFNTTCLTLCRPPLCHQNGCDPSWECPVVSGTRTLVADPLGRKVGLPCIWLVPAHTADARSGDQGNFKATLKSLGALSCGVGHCHWGGCAWSTVMFR